MVDNNIVKHIFVEKEEENIVPYTFGKRFIGK
jgi:hypothetical protein